MAPLAQHFTLQLTIGKDTYHRLQYAQALLSHVIPTMNGPRVFDRALCALIRELERRKFTR